MQGISIKGIYSSTYGDQGARLHQELANRLSELDKKRKYEVEQKLLVVLDRTIEYISHISLKSCPLLPETSEYMTA